MKTEKLKQNVKGYVHQFEDGGLRLLRKGQKGVIHAIFSRFGLVLILLLLQVGLLFSIFRWFGNLWPHYFGGSVVVTSAMVIYLLNSKMDNSAKITWMVVVAIAPVVGIPMFFYVKSNFGHNILRKRLLELEDQLRGWLPQSQKAVEQLKALEPGAASLAKYLYGRGGGFPVYQNTAMTYFPGGEAKFEELLRQLETAEEYIFVEYFIIDEGLMWGKILEVLARKALQGVDVRVMYDGTCEFSTLPRNYPRLLEKLNIQCKVFSPVQPFVSTHYNYRDHRKILVIDGRVGFTGGVNLADEYINHIQKHGRWKDAAVMLEGEAVRSLTAQFLQMWGILKEPEYEQFLTRPIPVPENAKGVAAPYGDCPLDGERVGEMVYIDLLNRARDYIHIMTPYLILDGELETALKFAAERGVDVHLILPGKPDKQFPYALAKSHYSALLDSGVKISEWSPGFVHAKVFVVDGREAAYDSYYGNYVVITDSKGYTTKYAHMDSLNVSAGQSIKKGDNIGKSGNTGSSTGSHLHIECLYNGVYYNPLFYFEAGEQTIYGETTGGTGGGTGNVIPPESYDDATVQTLMREANRYLGMPYTFGGTAPASFDCSGFVCWVFTNSGVHNLPRTTAQGIYDQCTPVSAADAKAGDIIFFTGTYNAGRQVTHVGIYCGNGTMVHCGDPIQYTSINTSYWQSHFYGFGRLN